MRVKRFVADTMQEAIARVKEEYGPDAVILQTRTFRRGLFGLLGSRRTEVLAAVDPGARRPRPAAAPGLWLEGPAGPPDRPAPGAGGARGPASAGADARSAAAERAALLGRPGAWTTEVPRPAPLPPVDHRRDGEDVDGRARLAEPPAPRPALWEVSSPQGLAEARDRGLATLSNGHGSPTAAGSPAVSVVTDARPEWPPGLDRVYRRLLDQAVEPVFARRIAEGILPLLPPGVPVSPQRMTTLVRDHLASLIPVSPSLRLGAGNRRIVVLVGPTGVGKTTSLAKLAAHYGLMAGHPVGLLTFDTYRVGAADQLRTYAEIIGIPMEVVYHPGELAAALARMADRHLILVDTAGRSPHDLMRLQEMRSFLRLLPEPEVYLVLSATVRFADLVRAAERFEPLGYRHLILTKVDETTAPGMVVNAVFQTGRPLAYLSNGQDVPDDFEAADPDRIAAQLLEDTDE